MPIYIQPTHTTSTSRTATPGLDRTIWVLVAIQSVVFIAQVLRFLITDLPPSLQPTYWVVISLYVIAAATLAGTAVVFARTRQVSFLCGGAFLMAMIGSNMSVVSETANTGSPTMAALAFACTVALIVVAIVRSRKRPTYPGQRGRLTSPRGSTFESHRSENPVSTPFGSENR